MDKPAPGTVGLTQSGKVIGTHQKTGYANSFTHQDHKDAMNAHYTAFENEKNPTSKQHHLNMSKKHQQMAMRSEPKSPQPSTAQPKYSQPSSTTSQFIDIPGKRVADLRPGVNKSGEPIPAKVDEPKVFNRMDRSKEGGKAINGPVIINSYKNEDGLEKIDPKTHLPGVLLDKGMENKNKLVSMIKKYMSMKKAEDGSETKSWIKKSSEVEAQLDKGALSLDKTNEKGVHGVRPEKKGVSTAGIEAVNSKKIKDMAANIKSPVSSKDNAMYTSNALGNAAKQSHKKVLNELKSMPKPNLPKNEEGINQPSNKVSYFQHGKQDKGVSEAGIKAREAKHPMSVDEYDHSADIAKEKHKAIISKLKSMKKPNLPK